jgi:death-on-curing protein
MDIDYITLDDALEAIDLLGQVVRDAGLLRGALARPDTWAFGAEVYPTVDLKAAALCDGINRSHPLIDGNKRLSWLLTVLFCRRNGFDLFAIADDGEEFMLSVAEGHQELSNIASWLEAHRTVFPDA